MNRNCFIYSLRINLLPDNNFNERLLAVINFCKESKIKDVMFFIDAEEYNGGHTTVEIAKKYELPLKEAKILLEKEEITLSLNPWVTLGHGDRGRTSPYETMVDVSGTPAKMTACPLSEKWLKNLTEVYAFLAAELKPDILWLEDDLRLHNHAPLNFGGCFCEKHMALYQKKLNKQIDRKTFVNGLFSKKTSTDFRLAYRAVNNEAYLKITESIRQAVAPYGVTLGLMTSDPNMYAIEGRDNSIILQALDGGNGVGNRIHLPMYGEISPLVYGWGFNTISMLSRLYSTDNSSIMPEIENYPSNAYTKSAAVSAFQIESALPLIARGATLNIFDFGGNGVFGGEKLADNLNKLYPYLETVKSLGLSFKNLKGVVVPVSNESTLTMQTTYGKDILELYPNDNWWGGMLGSFGVNFYYSKEKFFSGKTLAISGQWLRNLTAKEIKKLFDSNKILLDAKAAITLIEIGLGALINAESYEFLEENSDIYHYMQEKVSGSLLGIKNARMPLQFGCGNIVKFNYSSYEKAYTEVFHRSGKALFNGILSPTLNTLILPFEGYSRAVGLLHSIVEKSLASWFTSSKGEVVHIAENNISVYNYKYKNGDCYILTNFGLDYSSQITFENLPNRAKIIAYSVDFPEGKNIEFYKDNNLTILRLMVKPMSTLTLIIE